MNGSKIEYVLTLTPGIQDMFCGFGSPDTLIPPFTKFPSVYILNTAVSSSPGEHWCVFCIEDKSKGYFFDSFGSSPWDYGFNDPLFKQIKVECNTRPLQHYFSSTCGHHCLYFCIKYGNGVPIPAILSSYSDNQKRNDFMVLNFVRDNFGEVIARV